MNNSTKLAKIMASVFSVPEEVITDKTSIDNLSQWDSVKHLNLVLCIEDEFHISLSEEQILEMLSFELVKIILSEHGVNFND